MSGHAVHRILALWALLPAAWASGAGVELAPRTDGSYVVTTPKYRAVIGADGCLASLHVEGVKLFEGSGIRGTQASAAKPTAKLAVKGSVLTAEVGSVELRWTFDETGITIETRGGALEYLTGKSVTALVCRDGRAVGPKTSVADVAKLAGAAASLSIDKPFHHTYGRFWPSLLARGGKAETPLTVRIECGVAVASGELICIESIEAVGHKPNATPTYRAGVQPRVRLALRNLATVPAGVEARFTVRDHPGDGKIVLDKAMPVSLAGGEAQVVAIDVPLPAPGPYWLGAELLREGKRLQGTRLGLLYEAEGYLPPLTRPADFAEFWASRLKALRTVPFDAKLAESPAQGNERFAHYDLEIAVAAGKRVRTFLRVPHKAGPHDAEVHSYWSSTTPQDLLAGLAKLETQPPGAGMWQRGADRIRVGAPQPDDSKYTRWAGRDDNNMLDSYLMNVRMADFLRSRKDVAGIWLFGASRSGASMLAAAALGPERVRAVNVHVPTCCGLSWADKPYRGWGRPPAPTQEGLRVAGYFDPVNFAPDLIVPLVMDGGFYDDLAPAPGILAFANWARKAPFRRCALLLGGHGFFPPGPRRDMEADLAEHLGPAETRKLHEGSGDDARP